MWPDRGRFFFLRGVPQSGPYALSQQEPQWQRLLIPILHLPVDHAIHVTCLQSDRTTEDPKTPGPSSHGPEPASLQPYGGEEDENSTNISIPRTNVNWRQRHNYVANKAVPASDPANCYPYEADRGSVSPWFRDQVPSAAPTTTTLLQMPYLLLNPVICLVWETNAAPPMSPPPQDGCQNKVPSNFLCLGYRLRLLLIASPLSTFSNGPLSTHTRLDKTIGAFHSSRVPPPDLLSLCRDNP
ncbi:hypothetical protein N7462_002857 [Penicillium macrosclerotiorum]|uniref:uncharacterized protein n=1 Tax=Penicillium macrosclerotiorum TaxID=303699 RepID=UPI002547602B|nr:uncharacterized protein N7462_002857 [Penicillium macrosclerotiorum]KAJ5693434.1 hypothetical protein N7462_002857 [Penicillium macrosclerotiorum]